MRYQTRLVNALDSPATPYGLTVIDASRSAARAFRELRLRSSRICPQPAARKAAA